MAGVAVECGVNLPSVALIVLKFAVIEELTPMGVVPASAVVAPPVSLQELSKL
jgi:hypothetical protein